MTDPAIHKLQLADHPSTHHAHDNEPEDEADVEVAYVTGDSELTYISGKTGGAGKSSAASPTPVNDFVDFLVYRVTQSSIATPTSFSPTVKRTWSDAWTPSLKDSNGFLNSNG